MPRTIKAKVNDSTKSSSAVLNKFRQRIPSRNDDVPQSNDEGADNGKQDEGQADSITVKIICEGYGKAVYENIPSSVTIKSILNFWREMNMINHDAYNLKLASRGMIVDANNFQQLERERAACGSTVVFHAQIILVATIKFMEHNAISTIRYPQNQHFITFLKQNLRWSNARSVFMYKQTEEEQTYKVLTEKDNFDEAQMSTIWVMSAVEA